MASIAIGRRLTQERKHSLMEIDAVVSARLGPTRVPGNAQPACFNRQIAMYLAARLGGCSTTSIGQFYNGRDHSTVCYGIQRVEALLESDPEVDALIAELTQNLCQDPEHFQAKSETKSRTSAGELSIQLSASQIESIAELVAMRVLERLRIL